ncbi:MAG: hypothetical protein ACE5HV_10125 [Acidobacteriota bacterium]
MIMTGAMSTAITMASVDLERTLTENLEGMSATPVAFDRSNLNISTRDRDIVDGASNRLVVVRVVMARLVVERVRCMDTEASLLDALGRVGIHYYSRTRPYSVNRPAVRQPGSFA